MLYFLLQIVISSVYAAPSQIIAVSDETEIDAKKIYGLRVLFVLENNQWHQFDSKILENKKWSIAFDGKKVGNIETRQTKTVLNSETIQHYSKKVIPKELKVSNPTDYAKSKQKFYNWRSENSYRPLVVLKTDFSKDPDVWKPRFPEPEIAEEIKKNYSKNFPKDLPCGDRKIKLDISQWVIYGSYYSKNKGWLSEIKTPLSGQQDCDIEDKYSALLSPSWVFQDLKGKITILPFDMALVDAGDYDNDGSSEIIFQIHQENEDGYLLFAPKGEKTVRKTWTYH